MLGFENYQIESWVDSGLVKKMPSSPSSSQFEQMRKVLKKSQSVVTAITLGLASTFAISHIDKNTHFSEGQIIEYIDKKDFSIQQQLLISLASLLNMSEGLKKSLDVQPTKFSLAVAQWIINKLPSIKAEATLGIDFDGELYFKFITDSAVSYLSLEGPNLMHLLINHNNGSQLMLDDIAFKKGHIPKEIMQQLSQL